MCNIIKTLSAVLCLTTVVNAQQKPIQNFAKTNNAKITLSEQGTPKFIRFTNKNKALRVAGDRPSQKAVRFLNNNKALFGFHTISEELKLKSSKKDNYGLNHTLFQQEYKGIPVFDGMLRFHFNVNNAIAAINGNVIPITSLNTVPKLSKSEAVNKALTVLEKQNINYSGEPLYNFATTLYVFQKGLIENQPSSLHLAYEVELRNNADVREFLYIDAHSGEVIEQFTGIAHALNRELYDNTAEAANLKWKEGDAFPGALNQWQKNEVTTAGHVYNFFKSAFGRDSFDNKGAVIRIVNVADTTSGCPNAYWSASKALFCEGTAADDVVAHELGHAYTEYSSNLIYAHQSGAMNESFSDIWGETIDLINNYEDEDENLDLRTDCNTSDRWMIGEDGTAFGEPLRDMWKPSCKSGLFTHPDKMADYVCLDLSLDVGGVHINSGIPNHLYALLVDGGEFNGQTIQGIGFTKAAHIFWRTQSEYLTRTSDFEDLATALVAAAQDLLAVKLNKLSTATANAVLSEEKITETDITQLQNAIKAVGLSEDNAHCGYKKILEPIDALCEAATTTPIFNENWENGLGGWNVTQLPSNPSSWESRDWVLQTALPDKRVGQGVFAVSPNSGDCKDNLQNGILRLESPDIPITKYEDGTYEMAFTHYIATERHFVPDDTGILGEIKFIDGADIKYSINNSDWVKLPKSAFTANPYNATLEDTDNPLAKQEAFAGANQGSNTGSWGTSVVNLTSIGVKANDNIKFRFDLGTDGCGGIIGWYIDEVVVFNCGGSLLVNDDDKIDEAINVHPNPFNDFVTIKTSKDVTLSKVEVFDITGRLVKTLTNLDNNDKKINLTTVSKGVYFALVHSSMGSKVFKLVKN